MILEPYIEEFKRFAEIVFPSHCPLGLYVLVFHHVNHLVEEL